MSRLSVAGAAFVLGGALLITGVSTDVAAPRAYAGPVEVSAVSTPQSQGLFPQVRLDDPDQTDPGVSQPDPADAPGCGAGYYVNVDGDCIHSPSEDDGAGATGQCNDGTYTYAVHHRGACSHHGGVATWF